MEEMTVVHFILEEEGRGKKRRRGKWEYHVEKESLPVSESLLVLYTVFLPFFCYKKKEWTAERFSEYFKGLPIPPQSREVYYLYQEKAQNFLGVGAEPISHDWLLFLIKYYQVSFDALILLPDEEMETEDIIRRYVKNTRYIGIASEETEDILELRESLFQEYGCLIDVAADMKKLHIPAAGRKLAVAGEELYGAVPGLFKGAWVWISTNTDKKNAARLCARVENVRYIDMKTFLRGIRT